VRPSSREETPNEGCDTLYRNAQIWPSIWPFKALAPRKFPRGKKLQNEARTTDYRIMH
jgi:hypothetical protein